MDSWDHLQLARTIPGEDESWLTRGWLLGSSVTEEIRATIIDWLIQVQQYLSLSDVTLHLAVANFDLVLSSVEVEDDEVQLVGLVCLSLAAKVEEDCPPSPDLMLPLTGDVYTKADLSRMEKEAISALKWKLKRTTSVVFLHYYSEIIGKTGKSVFKLARAILDLCLEQTWYGTVPPSHLASTVLLAASYLEGKGWPQNVAKMTGHSPSQLMASLVIVLNMVTGEDIREGILEKHSRAMAKIRALGADSVRVIVKNVQEEEVASVPDSSSAMFLL